MEYLSVQIVRCVDEYQPGIVACDFSGRGSLLQYNHCQGSVSEHERPRRWQYLSQAWWRWL
jgi:hypothetical protein